MSNHTPEPWLINENCADEVGVLCAENTQEYGSIIPILLAYGNKANANARRIVACVNVCKGLSNEDLENGALFSAAGIELFGENNEIKILSKQLTAVTARRDELLETMHKLACSN